MAHQFSTRVDSIKTSIKSVDSNGKKCKKLLGGYEKIIKSKTEEINMMNE
jgi:hypothetical protein